MFMRLVQLRVKPESSMDLTRVYTEKVLPALQDTPGCMYASLIRNTSNADEAMSMTLWQSVEHSHAYEKSGKFQGLMSELAPYADTSEWRVQLSKDLTLEYTAVHEEPVVKSYMVASTSDDQLPDAAQSPLLYVRILSVSLQEGMTNEFRKLYATEILPILHNVSGCRYAFLTEGLEGGNEVLSVTIWNSKDAADVYESTGLFHKLMRKVTHTFSEVYQWKMAAQQRSGVQVSTSQDPEVRGYDVVSGRSFR